MYHQRIAIMLSPKYDSYIYFNKLILVHWSLNQKGKI